MPIDVSRGYNRFCEQDLRFSQNDKERRVQDDRLQGGLSEANPPYTSNLILYVRSHKSPFGKRALQFWLWNELIN